jgi:hypothetical protein
VKFLKLLNPLSWLTGAAGSLVQGLAGVVANAIVTRGNTEASRQADQNASGVAVAQQYLLAHGEANRQKALRPLWYVLFGMLAFATPVGLHWWATMLDSMPFYVPWVMDSPHRVGSWRVAANWKGEFQETYHKIIDSFFIAAPATGALMALLRAFMR